MGSKFGSELSNKEGVTTLKLAGVVDEDNELTSLEPKLGAGPTVLDLSEIDRINSCGVRDWVNWLGRIEKTGARLVFVNCSPAIVAQINLVHNFTANGIVKSFYAPYFCPRCEKEKLLRLETRDLIKSAPITTAPACRCDECDGPMDFDDMEESYFAFLNNAKKVLGDPSFEQTMKEIAAAGETGGKMRARPNMSIPPVTAPSTSGPTQVPASSSSAAPSAVSPHSRTPTGTGKTPTGTTPTGGPAGFAGPTGSPTPQRSSAPNLPLARTDVPAALTTSIPPSSSPGLPPSPSSVNNKPVPPPPKPIVPWLLLGAFLLAAVGLLVFVLSMH